MNELKFLEEQGVSSSLINKIVKFREVYPVSDEVKNRIIKPAIPFYGKDILEMAIAGILQGQNLLLTGPKATGKNILAENLAYIFNRPSYNISFHVNIDLHPAARFIGTMNYGYAGTKELNEALVSRFLVIDMPAQTEETLGFIFHQMFPNARESAIEQFVGLFLDLQLKALNSEISTKALDLRGLLAAMKIVDVGLSPAKAVRMGVVNKTFDVFEKEIVEDVVSTRIPSEWTREDVYE